MKRLSYFFTLLLLSCIVSISQAQYNISTVVGSSRGYSGDGGTATSAELNVPIAIKVDASGNLYIADRFNHRIRKVDPSNKITTIAGTGVDGYNGDGNLAINTRLSDPFGVAIDKAGNIYIVDASNHRIRKVAATTRIVTTIAGTRNKGFSGDGGKATSARLNLPQGVAVDNLGNIYIADADNHRIRKVSASTGKITTIIGSGAAGYSGDGGKATAAKLNQPSGIVWVRSSIYIADRDNHCIRKVNSSGIITTVAGTGIAGFSGDGGKASLAQLNDPVGVTIDASGNIYIADSKNHRIRKVSAATGNITTIAGTRFSGFSGDGGQATKAELDTPTRVSIDASGNIYIADAGNHRIRKLSLPPTPKLRVKQAGKTIANGKTARFGNTDLDTDKALEFVIENKGKARLNITNITIDGDFSLGSPQVTAISAESSAKLTIVMDGSSYGDKTGNLIIKSNDPAQATYSVKLAGTTKIEQTITFDIGSNATKMVDAASFDLVATGGKSGNPVTFTSSNKNVATVSGKTVTIVGAGTTTIEANQAGNTQYLAATEVTQKLTIKKYTQTITFDLGNDANKVVGDATFDLVASGGDSGNPVTFTSSDKDVATISGKTVTIVGIGTTTITARQAGDATYITAPRVTQTLTVEGIVAGLPQNLQQGKPTLFPNPVSLGTPLLLEMKGKVTSKIVQVRVFDKQGREVRQMQLKLNEQYLKIPTHQLAAGHYVLKLQIGKEIIARKISIY